MEAEAEAETKGRRRRRKEREEGEEGERKERKERKERDEGGGANRRFSGSARFRRSLVLGSGGRASGHLPPALAPFPFFFFFPFPPFLLLLPSSWLAAFFGCG